MTHFQVTSSNNSPLAELCERHANELWIPAHLTPEQAEAFVLEHFKKTLLRDIEKLEVTVTK